MHKNICIIHFNTPALTSCLVRSINKYTPGTTVYIFDNSDKAPFINTFDNVIVLDNTKGELVNFEEVLKQYPKRGASRGRVNNFGSAKHSMSIQKCIELIDDNFVLMDSDILLKKDITPIYNERYVWVGGIEEWFNRTLKNAPKKKRTCPFLLFMNVNKMKEMGITFYDDQHMLGLNNGPKCEEYETGVWFYEKTPAQYRKIIRYNDYILHFRAGSWLDDAREKQNYKQIDPKRWLTNNKKYWLKDGETLPRGWYEKYSQPKVESTEERPVKKISKNFGEVFDHIYCHHYLPNTDRLPKLKSELRRVGIDENAKYFSWVYDYPSPLLDLVFKNENLKIDKMLSATSRGYIKDIALRHYEIMKEALALGYKRILIMEDTVRFHNDREYIGKMLENLPDSDIVMFDKMVSSSIKDGIRYREYSRKLLAKEALYGDMGGIFYIFPSCYALNEEAMKYIVERQEEILAPADTPFNDTGLTGSFAVINVAIQDPALNPMKNESYERIKLDVTQYGKDEEIKEEEASKPNASSVPVTVLKRKIAAKVTPKRKVIRPAKPNARPRTVMEIRETLKTRPKPVTTQKKPQRVQYTQTVSHNRLYDV